MKKQWWHNKVAYQIYPKSFCDSNGDGIGDLPGIISKLDYLKDLGVDILWLSPIYVSPLADQGYDIADYYNIDPRFGTMEDMERLLTEAHKRNMYILMDLVVNHCSDEHIWFQKACADPEGRYGKFFYLEHTSDPSALCNWRSYFGGPVWQKLPGHEDWYYLHVFHRKQPDLNWENPDLRQEVYRMINWWLDKGLDGFRLDAIINIKKALPFRSYPADRPDGLSTIHNMLHDASGVGEFLTEMRDQCFIPLNASFGEDFPRKHPAFTVGEVFNEKPDELPDFIGDQGYFSTMFDFSEAIWGQSQMGWQENRDITPDDYRNCVFATQEKIADIGMLSNIIENHDEPRGASRYIPEGDQNPTSKKLLATVYFMLKGLPWIYQGQEIGMENLHITSIEEVDDIASIDSYKVAMEAGVSERDALHMIEKYGRDNARTPFQWNAEKHGGFTSGTPWLRTNPNYTSINLAAQEEDPDSVFRYYQKLIRLRKNPEYADTLIYGDFSPLFTDVPGVMAYCRESADQKIFVIANYQKKALDLSFPWPVKKILLSNLSEVSITEADPKSNQTLFSSEVDKTASEAPAHTTLHLEGYQAVILEG